MDLFTETRGSEDGEGGQVINLIYFMLQMIDCSPTMPLFQTSLAWITKTKVNYLASHQMCESSRNYAQDIWATQGEREGVGGGRMG
jgi:hypothetical protein